MDRDHEELLRLASILAAAGELIERAEQRVEALARIPGRQAATFDLIASRLETVQRMLAIAIPPGLACRVDASSRGSAA